MCGLYYEASIYFKINVLMCRFVGRMIDIVLILYPNGVLHVTVYLPGFRRTDLPLNSTMSDFFEAYIENFLMTH